PGYSLLAEPIAEAALAASRATRGEGATVSVDLSSWSAIRAYGPERFRGRLEELAPDVVFANEPEWELVGGAYALAETAVLKRGSRGVVVHAAGARRSTPRSAPRSSTRPARATRLRRDSSWAESSLVSKRRPAASPSWGRGRRRRAQGRPEGPGGLRGAGSRRRDDRRRHACGLPPRRDPLPRHRRHRRRPPRLCRAAGHLGRPDGAGPHAGARGRLRGQVAARRPRDRRGARDPRRPGPRLPHRRAPALLRRRRRATGLGPSRVPGGGSPHRTGS